MRTVGGKKPPAREGLRFMVASSGAVYIPQHQFAGARRQFSGIGAFVITIETTEGVRINVWPAMPPKEQWTDLHDENR